MVFAFCRIKMEYKIIKDNRRKKLAMYVEKDGTPAMEEPVVEPWKCPYHNGRMCMEIINRTR